MLEDGAVEHDGFDEHGVVGQDWTLGPSVVFVVDHPSLEQDVQIAADDADVSVKAACELADGRDFRRCEVVDKLYAFLGEHLFGGFSAERESVRVSGFREPLEVLGARVGR